MNCRLCDQPASARSPGNYEYVECQTCGKYQLTTSMLRVIQDVLSPRIRDALSAYTRQTPQRADGDSHVLDASNYENYARQHIGTSVSTKLRRLLKHMALQTQETHPGAKVQVTGKMYPLFDAARSEMGYLTDLLAKRGDVEREANSFFRITEQGWKRLEPIAPGGEPGTCFVAMASDMVNRAYEPGIRAAVVTDCGFDVILVEKVEHNGSINDLIIAELRRCQCLVADFSHHRNGVYFEAGFARGLGREVISTCLEKEFTPDKVHFDTRPYNHILWEKAADLREQLTARIRATVPGARLSTKPEAADDTPA